MIAALESNSAKGKAFQIAAATFLGQHFGTQFQIEQPIAIGIPPKQHRFDFVSRDLGYVGEAKDFAWTEGNNVPSAKIATINEAVLYLQHLPQATVRFVVMPRRTHPKRSESVAEYYFRTYQHLLDSVRVIEIDLASGTVHEFKPRSQCDE